MALIRQTAPEGLALLAQPGTPLVALLAVRVAILITTWATRRRTRLALAKLEPWQLDDVGVTPAEAEIESARVFWRG